MTLKFTLPIQPPRTTHQQKGVRIVRQGSKTVPMFYEKKKVQEVRTLYNEALLEHAPAEPIEGAIALDVEWKFCSRSHKQGEWKTTKPDVDNMTKLLLDCMTDVGFWNDDAQVVRLTTAKYWADVPGIEIAVEALL